MIMHIPSEWKLMRAMTSLVTIGICRTTALDTEVIELKLL